MNLFVLNITNRCNFKCGHCFREGASKEDLPLATIAGALPTLRQLGARTLALTGGEPILHPEFGALVEQVTRAGFRIGCVTNGWFTPRYLAALAPYRAQVAYVAISLDGPTAAAHDALRAQPGSFAAVMASIEAFHAAGFPINLSHVVSRHTATERDLRALADLLVGLPFTSLTVGAVVPTPRNGPVQLGSSPRRLEAAVLALREALGPRVRITPALGLGRSYAFCGNLHAMNDVALRYDGDVVFCCDAIQSNRGAVLGNVHREPLIDILRRHPQKAATVLAARMAAMAAGRATDCNDCAFCNRVLAGDAAPVTARPLEGRAPAPPA